jgi:hypothetical protein
MARARASAPSSAGCHRRHTGSFRCSLSYRCPWSRPLAAALAAGPTVALGLTKWLINTGYERGVKEQLTQEAMGMELSSRSPDFREGLAAFIEKRDPKFTGQ